MKRVTVLGSTGSVGVNTLDLIGRNPDRFAIEALTANSNADALIQQALALRPRFVAIGDPTKKPMLESALAGLDIEVGAGREAIIAAAERPADLFMAAIVGAAGLAPTLAAVRHGTTVALANKECLVSAGQVFMSAVAEHGATLLPVDSEHSAVFQVFDAAQRNAVARIILTASGGPFRDWTDAKMAVATPSEAVAHPNWDMGAKISVDSATMMNKGLELIEAHYLFGLEPARIDILVHPQSVVHSLVEYVDGSVLAQLGTPDMRTPISYALAWPERMATPHAGLDLVALGALTFEAPNHQRFPALSLARHALQAGGAAPTILNAANEVAVARFLAGEIGFLAIAGLVEDTLAACPDFSLKGLDDVLAADAEARRIAGAQDCLGSAAE